MTGERFIKRRRYPKQFPRQPLADNQSPVPSQYSPVPLPFVGGGIGVGGIPNVPGIGTAIDLVPTGPPDYTEYSIVRNVFDSRPPGAFDWFWEDAWLAGVNQRGGYTVPNSYVLFVRSIVLAAYPVLTGDNLHNNFIDAYGNDTSGPFDFFVTINGASAATFTPTTNQGPVRLFDLFSSDVEIPCFILLDAGQNLTVSIPGVTSLATSVTTSLTVQYYGNLLQKTNRNLIEEVGNFDPDLVVEEKDLY